MSRTKRKRNRKKPLDIVYKTVYSKAQMNEQTKGKEAGATRRPGRHQAAIDLILAAQDSIDLKATAKAHFILCEAIGRLKQMDEADAGKEEA